MKRKSLYGIDVMVTYFLTNLFVAFTKKMQVEKIELGACLSETNTVFFFFCSRPRMS